MASDFEFSVMQELSAIKSTSASNAATLAALNERLFDGPSSVITTVQDDIQEMKDDRKSDARWERLHNVLHYSLTPVVVGIHLIARRIGINI
jgi:hypothetical protein